MPEIAAETADDPAEALDAVAARRSAALRALWEAGAGGLTWAELGLRENWHHGQSSGVLSVLHRTGHIARLTERRGRSRVYVLTFFVHDRATEPYGRRAAPACACPCACGRR